MEATLDTFKTHQSHALRLLDKLRLFLRQGEEVGVAIDPSLHSKVEHAIDSVSGEKLKVALIGGFSEGKTSIAAAWMEELDKSSMKISHQESSDEVRVYEISKEFMLIDTPGLFGFKEQVNSETHAVERYKEITKKYVSEAHLVLYVMNSTNPIKESHKDDLVWLLRTLDLFPRTIFVLSRFDEIADVEDERDYQHHFEIKRSNVTDRLRELIDLKEGEVGELSIVAVAANPFDAGVEYWLDHIEEFKMLSHISALQEATTEKIRESGGSLALVNEMLGSVIRDVLSNQLPFAIEIERKVSHEVAKLTDLSGQQTSRLEEILGEIEGARIALCEFAMRYFTDLILQAKGCSIETFGEFLEREIGSEGIILETRLKNEFSRQTQSINIEIKKTQVGFDAEINHFNATVKSLGKGGINYLTKGNVINNSTVLATRDGIVSVAKAVGLDIGKYLKFKPWGAVKFAKGATGALVVFGFALEVYDSVKEHKRQEAFRETIAEMVSAFEGQRKEFIELINSEQFKEKFFSDYLRLKEDLQGLDEILQESHKRQHCFQEWRIAAETIDAEFRELNESV